MTTDERLDRIDAAIERFSQGTMERFDRIDQRLDAMDQRFDRIDQRLDAMDQRFDRIDRRLDAMDQRFERIDERFERVDAALERLTLYVTDLRDETKTRLEAIEWRLGVILPAITSIDSRIPALTKGVFDAGTISSQLLVEHAKQKESSTDLVTRVMKLEETVARLLAA